MVPVGSIDDGRSISESGMTLSATQGDRRRLGVGKAIGDIEGGDSEYV